MSAGFTRLTLVLAWLAAALFVAAGAMLTWEVLARYFFVRPTIWAAELSQLCLIWGSLLGMPWALAARRHIAVDAVTNLLTPRLRRQLDAVAMGITALFSALVLWKGFEIAWDSYERGRKAGTMLDPPAWLPEAAVPVGFALLLVQALIEMRRALAGHDAAAGIHE